MRLWPFRRVRDVRHQCGNWRAGDLAVCIGDRWHIDRPHNPKLGEVLRVTDVEDVTALSFLGRWLSFEGRPSYAAYDARDFRKAVRDDQPASADFRLPARQPGKVDA